MDKTTEQKLYTEIHQAIENSIIGLPSTQEPDYIAALITKLPQDLSTILNTILLGKRFKVGGCFVHQKPLAKFCDSRLISKSPELGDLLIVYKENRIDGPIYNALLLQAKKTDNVHNTPISSTDAHQLLLYTKWPMFEYRRAGTTLNGQRRSITPKTITTGAQYLLINNTGVRLLPILPPTFWCAMPNIKLDASDTLALQIIKLINFETGKPFVANGIHIDHWSKMIWDLLKISTTSRFNRRAAGYNRTTRYFGDYISLLLDLVNDRSVHVNKRGISMLCIESEMENECVR